MKLTIIANVLENLTNILTNTAKNMKGFFA